MVNRSNFLHRLPDRVGAGRATLVEKGWLSVTPVDFQEALLDITVWRTAEAGTEFSRSGDDAGGLIAIGSGIAEISIESGHPDTRFVHIAHAGSWAGYRPLLGKSRNVTFTARSKLLWALVPQSAMERLLEEQPRFWRHIALLADGAYETTAQIMVDLTRHNGRSRVAATLLRMAGCRNADQGAGTPLEIRVPQADIAALAVMSRNTLGGYLTELATLGLIEIHYRNIHIINAPGLRNLLESEE